MPSERCQRTVTGTLVQPHPPRTERGLVMAGAFDIKFTTAAFDFLLAPYVCDAENGCICCGQHERVPQ